MKKISLILLYSCILIFFLNENLAGVIRLAWNPIDSNTLAGYMIYYGNQSGLYGEFIDVGNVTTFTLKNLQDCEIYYIAATAYDIYGSESDYSNEVSGPARRSSDTDNNQRIDGLDLTFLALHFGAQQGDSYYDPSADFNCDGWIDGEDLAILSAHFGEDI